MSKQIHIKYYAVLREQANCGSETVSTSAETPIQLYNELSQRHDFSLHGHHIKVSINDNFEAMESKLSSDDRVVFIPPVAGG